MNINRYTIFIPVYLLRFYYVVHFCADTLYRYTRALYGPVAHNFKCVFDNSVPTESKKHICC